MWFHFILFPKKIQLGRTMYQNFYFSELVFFLEKHMLFYGTENGEKKIFLKGKYFLKNASSELKTKEKYCICLWP